MCYAGTATSSHVPSPVKKVFNQIVRLTTREKRKHIKWYPPINVAELGRPRLQSRPVDLHLCLTLVSGFHLILRCAASILVRTFRTAVWRWQVAVCAPATPAPRRPRVGPRTRGGSLGRREREGGGWGETQAGRARGRKGSQTMATIPVSRILTSLHIAVLDRQAEYCKYARVHIYSPGVMQYSTKRPSRFRSGGGGEPEPECSRLCPPDSNAQYTNISANGTIKPPRPRLQAHR